MKSVQTIRFKSISLSLAVLWTFGVCSAAHAAACDVVDCVACKRAEPPPMKLQQELQTLLPPSAIIRRILDTQMTARGEKAILYDSDRDELEPSPRIAIYANGEIVETFAAEAPGGFTRLLADCQFPLAPGRHGLALAYRAGGDGSLTTFLLIGFQSGKYRVLQTVNAPRSRMVFDGQVGQFALWAGEGSDECVWCKQRYEISKYKFNGTRFVRVTSKKSSSKLDPGEIADVPLQDRR